MTVYDEFFEAKQIADRIELNGFKQQATDIRQAIDRGRSGTELFMQIRFYLTPLIEDDKINAETRERIAILVGKLNEALAP